jgi:hypothetical protein
MAGPFGIDCGCQRILRTLISSAVLALFAAQEDAGCIAAGNYLDAHARAAHYKQQQQQCKLLTV